MNTSNFINFSNLALIEQHYQNYLKNPNQLDPVWQAFFDGLTVSQSEVCNGNPSALKTYLLIQAYRTYGHILAKTNPLYDPSLNLPKVLDPKTYQFQSLEEKVPSFQFFEEPVVSLSQLINRLKEIYCGSLGFEYKNVGDFESEKWLEEIIEKGQKTNLCDSDKELIFYSIVKAEAFEVFLHTQFVGQKRFSLEGCETLIPMLEEILENCAIDGARQVVIGMAHRGRLNVLANIMGKSYERIFEEFGESSPPLKQEGSGDVKYHKGFQNTYKTQSGVNISVTLAANPSHLESVGSVVEGMCKAFQDALKRVDAKKAVIPIIIHGDAAIAGQGVVYETLQFSQIEGYSTGGTIHVVINNQIGFTALPQETKSTLYCTDISKGFNAPVIHVNAEDVYACAKAAKLAALIRARLNKDVFIDLIGYRKWGHNEGDEPFYTQPSQYSQIRKKESILSLFKQRLVKEGFDLTKLENFHENFIRQLKEKAQVSHAPLSGQTLHPMNSERKKIDLANMRKIAVQITEVPKELKPHPKIEKLYKERSRMLDSEKDKKIDWAFAELLSFATLMNAGISIRLSGQDAQRGTFSQRQAVIVNQENQSKAFPITKSAKDGASFEILNSPLSEFAELGFEFGYSIASKNCLVLWEAQYGDFANGAQVIIDQYISSGRQKWGVQTNLTLLLPHGYEGQGPEHSSARMERYLQLCAQKNMRVAIPTTPSQYFHLLQKQAYSDIPCIIFTPKAMLRHPECISSAEDLVNDEFRPFICADLSKLEKADILMLSVGKIYYDLKQEIGKRKKENIALISIEQLYPLEIEELQKYLGQLKTLKKIVFVQDEPENMGALSFMVPKLVSLLKNTPILLKTVSRPESASPAVGSSFVHKKEFADLIENAFID